MWCESADLHRITRALAFGNRFRVAALPKADSRNEAGGPEYALPPKHALAQFAATGCLNATFYAAAEEQLAAVLDAAPFVTGSFLGKEFRVCAGGGRIIVAIEPCPVLRR